MITALRSDTFKQLQLNAGMFVRDFDPATYTDATALKTALTALLTTDTDHKLLGATRGGGTFSVTKELRSVEADGKRNEFVGSYVIDSVDAQLTGTLLEMTSDNIKNILSAGDVTTATNMATIRMRNALKDSDYIEDLCWVGDTSEGAMLIWFEHALNKADFNLTFTDKGEATLPFEFHALQENVSSGNYAPFKIILLKDSSTSGT